MPVESALMQTVQLSGMPPLSPELTLELAQIEDAARAREAGARLRVGICALLLVVGGLLLTYDLSLLVRA